MLKSVGSIVLALGIASRAFRASARISAWTMCVSGRERLVRTEL